MIALNPDHDSHVGEGSTKSVGSVITWIVLMNLIFSFDSILSAMALTKNFVVMATAIIIGGILMIWLSDKVAKFLQKNRMYEVLGLFILLIVRIMLLTEGGHLAHLRFFGHEVQQVTKIPSTLSSPSSSSLMWLRVVIRSDCSPNRRN